MISTIIAAILFYVLPILIGRSLVAILPYTRKFSRLSYPFISYFSAGALTIYAALLIGKAITFFGIPFETISRILIFALGFILIPFNLFISQEDLKIKEIIPLLLLSFFLGTTVYFVWTLNSPYPLNWDLFEHQTLTNNILSGKFSFIPSHVTDTFGFNGYSTIFHSLLAVSQMYFSPIILNYWNILSFLHLITVIFASYALGETVTGNKTIGYLSAVVGGAIFDSTISFTNLFLIPQTLTAVFFIFCFVQLLILQNKKQSLPLGLFVINSLFLFLTHYIIGFVAFLIYLALFLYFKFPQIFINKSFGKILLICFLSASLIGIFFSPSLHLSFLNKGEGEAFTLNIFDKYNIMRQSYGFLLPFFMSIGILTTLKKSRESGFIALVVFVEIFSVILMQLPYVVKFFVLGRFFVGLFIAIGVFTFTYFMAKPLRILSYIALILTIFVIFVANIYAWKGSLSYGNKFVNISSDEIKASEFLKKEYKRNAIIVSDPATQYILETLSQVNSQGGAYMDTLTRQKLAEFSLSNPRALQTQVQDINDKIEPAASTHLLALSGRYFMWQKSGLKDKLNLNFNIWHPTLLTMEDQKQINIILGEKGFKLVYSNPSITIVEVQPKQAFMKLPDLKVGVSSSFKRPRSFVAIEYYKLYAI